jgi:hypothetical protein
VVKPKLRVIAEGVGDERESPTVPKRWLGSGHHFRLPDGSRHRDRSKAPVSSRSAAQRWGEHRERHLLQHGQAQPKKKEAPTLHEFAPRFLGGHARANRQKPSGIAAKESILRNHLTPLARPAETGRDHERRRSAGQEYLGSEGLEDRQQLIDGAEHAAQEGHRMASVSRPNLDSPGSTARWARPRSSGSPTSRVTMTPPRRPVATRPREIPSQNSVLSSRGRRSPEPSATPAPRSDGRPSAPDDAHAAIPIQPVGTQPAAA